MGGGHGRRPGGLQWAHRPETHPWDEVEQGSWDGQERVFTLRWTQQDREDLTLKVPAGVRNGDAYASADVAPFAKALRQRVEAAIITAPWQRSPRWRHGHGQRASGQ